MWPFKKKDKIKTKLQQYEEELNLNSGPKTRFKDKTLLLKISLVTGILTLSMALTFLRGHTAFFIIMMLLGCLGFFPAGMLLGVLFDIRMRVRGLRMITRKNFGIVNIVSGKNTAPLIKNLDNDIIELNGNQYFLRKSRIYSSKDEVKAEITDDELKFESGIPSVYLDLDKLTFLTFHGDPIPINPQEISAPSKARQIIKEAEFMSTAKKITITAVAVLVVMCVATYFGYQNWQIGKESMAVLEVIKNQVLVPVAQNVTHVVTQG